MSKLIPLISGLSAASRFCTQFRLGLFCLAVAEGVESPDFDREVRLIFEPQWFSCHGTEKQKSGLRLDRRASMLNGGDDGEPASVPGNSADNFEFKLSRAKMRT